MHFEPEVDELEVEKAAAEKADEETSGKA
jgi:hypothetical protein